MSSHSHSPQRTRRAYSGIPGMEPDDSPPRNQRALRSSSMPLVPQHQSDITQSQPPPPSTITASYSSQRRSSPVPLSTQPQHVPPPNPSNFSTSHAQFHSHPDHGPDHSQAHAPSQDTPPLGFPRSVQRVPPPPLLPPDSRFTTIRDDWTMTDQLLAEIDRAAHDQDTSTANIAGIGAGPGSQQLPIPKGPVIERERDRERVRDKRDSPRDGEVAGSGGSTGSSTGRGGSLRQSSSSRVALAQPHQAQNQTPPRTPPHTQGSHSQAQRPLPVLPDRSQQGTSRSNERDRGSPTYYSPLAGSPVEPTHHGQSHTRGDGSPFRFDERLQMGAGPTKAKTPDRSLPVQEENEGEEDVTITPVSERARERDRQRDRELEMNQLKERTTRQMNHRLPTPQFSSSPMIPPERMSAPETSSDVELSSTVQGDEFNPDHDIFRNDHDGRSSRATHRFDEDGGHHPDESRQLATRHTLQQEVEDQEETESYTPRSHHASLPSVVTNTSGPERVVYNATQLHFRPRTASSDAGGMGNLDTAMLRDAIEKLQDPYVPQQLPHASARGQQGQQQYGSPGSPFSTSHPHGQHTALPARVPTAEDIRALVADTRAYEAWQASATNHIRPGAPVPPTPPNATTLSTLSYTAPSLSPGPLRSTPYPYSYPYQHLVHRSQDPQQILHYMQQQQLQQLQLLGASGMQTDSTFSPSSTPYPSYDYNPFLPEHFRRQNGVDEPSMSLRSSPSHMPVNLPMFPANRRLHPKRKSVRRMRGSRELASKLPPRGESTEPRETSPESSDGEEVDEGEFDEFNDLAARLETCAPTENLTAQRTTGDDDEGDWVDVEEDGEDDLLHLEYHPNFVVNPEKRRKCWELKWDALVKAFQALDRQTDSTLLLLAAPNHGKSTYAVRSRSLRRIPSLAKAPEMTQIRYSFRALLAQRQAARAKTRHNMSLAERFEYYASSTSSEGSESREEELKGALGAALSSLSALSSIYEGREQRWRTEMGRMGDERERVEVLLRQALGMGFGPGVI